MSDENPDKTAAENLVKIYGLEPYIFHDGTMGIHFMNLDWTIEWHQTLLEYVRIEIEDRRNGDGTIDGEERDDLKKWRATLDGAVAAINEALRD